MDGLASVSGGADAINVAYREVELRCGVPGLSGALKEALRVSVLPDCVVTVPEADPGARQRLRVHVVVGLASRGIEEAKGVPHVCCVPHAVQGAVAEAERGLALATHCGFAKPARRATASALAL